jgi:endoglycosylceramidase
VVAEFFKDVPNVLGYEIINEPLAGSPYHSLLDFVQPGRGNSKNLLPLYQRVSNQIRAHDTQKLVFFEPGTSDYLGGGFNDSPGGLKYRDREVYSYHIYCPLVDTHSVPKNDLACKLFDRLMFELKEKAAKKLNVGKFLTEFGAIEDSPGAYIILNIRIE